MATTPTKDDKPAAEATETVSKADFEALQAQHDARVEELASAREVLSGMDEKVDGLQQQLGNVTSERDQVANQLSDARSELAKVSAERDTANAKIGDLQNAASVESIAQGRKMRTTKAIVIDPSETKALKAYGEQLNEAIQGECEIVFSDGQREIRGLDPVRVSGPVWQRTPAGLTLTKPIELAGPPAGVSPYEIAGFALFDDEGDQVAWSALPEPIRVMPNGRTQIRHSIIF